VSDRSAERMAKVMQNVRTVLLDFDGPVCSIFAGLPAPSVATALAATAERAGHPVPPVYSGSRDPLDVLRYAGTVGPALTKTVEDELARAELAAAGSAAPTPGATEFLRACQATGRPVAVVSNNSAAAIRSYLARQDMTGLVAAIQGRNATDPRLMKPSPDVLQRGMRDLDVRPEQAAIVGDTVTDIAAGQAANVYTIGYANKPGKYADLQSAGADAVVTTMHELADLTRAIIA
jgi:HAD superfamily hydrolase (TIGR01509 family)